ncbi:HAD-IA family hydrolase [Amycolatopsis sp. cmx-4-83]|uniref:HAD-IA family hydrolase n=1 Tax=Amycolatopsis sp. cmx-4-83 TaxID=2790940 RepID=UPI00397D5834
MPAVLFGSASTLVDTSELQRQAFNQAFAEHGLDWDWDRDSYQRMLRTSGGVDRIAAYAGSVGSSVDAPSVHATKSRIFQESLAGSSPQLRPGVAQVISEARENGYRVGFVATTSPANVAALFTALRPNLRRQDLDVVIDGSAAVPGKDEAYRLAVRQLAEQPTACVAVEDNVPGVEAAVAAGLTCVAFPNANTTGHDFPAAGPPVDHLDFADLRRLVQE